MGGVIIALSNNLKKVFRILIKNGVLYTDKSKAGNVSFKKEFAAIDWAGIQLESIKNIKIFVDNYSVEIFINNGNG